MLRTPLGLRLDREVVYPSLHRGEVHVADARVVPPRADVVLEGCLVLDAGLWLEAMTNRLDPGVGGLPHCDGRCFRVDVVPTGNVSNRPRRDTAQRLPSCAKVFPRHCLRPPMLTRQRASQPPLGKLRVTSLRRMCPAIYRPSVGRRLVAGEPTTPCFAGSVAQTALTCEIESQGHLQTSTRPWIRPGAAIDFDDSTFAEIAPARPS